MSFLAIMMIAGGVGVLLWFVFGGATVTRKQMLANLSRQLEEAKDAAKTTISGEESKPSALSALMRRGMPAPMMKTITKLWANAGRPENNTPDRVLANMALFGGAGVIGGVIAAGVIQPPLTVVAAIGVPVLCFFLPIIRLQSAGKDRMTALKRQLPDTLDQMSIAVNAGLGFDAAMMRVAKGGKGELAEELVRTLQDISVGQSRRAAYEDLAARTNVDTLRRFVRSIIQAEAYGIALSDVLQSQAEELRKERRQYAERKAMEIPVKVVFPLILFIMPAMFIVVIGPGILGIVEAFSNMG